MRLINTSTLKFQEFIGRSIPTYAILSHTWRDEEVTHRDYVETRAASMRGYNKIIMTCNLAKEAGITHCWIDTCCIDKFSSAELTEAINSMYRWYKDAKICYVYLEDFTPGKLLPGELPNCRWFTRGWTLQELIAPHNIRFFDSEWNFIGRKVDLAGVLSAITGIDENILLHKQSLNLKSVAARMSWAARRETTRTEDMAYCLLGIFDVNLPLLYGEAEKAFQRLQEEIVRSTADLSILAWRSPRQPGVDRYTLTGVLARSPADFYSGGIVERMYVREFHEFIFTNVGIRTRFRNLWASNYGYVLQLNCYSADTGKALALRLRKVGRKQYLREGPYELLEYATGAFEEKRPVERYLLTAIPAIPMISESLDPSARFQPATELLSILRQFPVHIILPRNVEVSGMWPSDRWDEEDRLFFVSGDSRWDSFQLDLRYDLGYYPDSADQTVNDESVTLDFTLFALGWSHSHLAAADPASFGLVSRRQYGEAIDEVHRWISEEEPSTAAMSRKLAKVEIPKLQLIRYDIPQTSRTLVIKIKSTLNNYVVLTAEVLATKDVPEQVAERWPLFRDF